MGQFISIAVIVGLWALSFVEPSGWSVSIGLPWKVNCVLLAVSVFFFVKYPMRRLSVSRTFFWLTVLFMIVIPHYQSATWQGASYMVSFLTVYIVSQCTVSQKVVKYSCLAIAALGLMVLLIYVNGSVLRGWNDNAISMVGLFSFIYFSIYLISKRHTRAFWLWNLVTVAYLELLFQTQCRSGMLFSVLAVVAIYFAATTRRLLVRRRLRMLLLNVPLLLSIVVLLIASTSLSGALNDWSIAHFGKTLFNGRDLLWEYAYSLLSESHFIGTGKFVINYHNSGVAAITVFGIVGYICWIRFFSKNLNLLNYYISDNIVFGSMLAFLLIFLQQSVDLGFISEYPNLLPYTILGLGLGRIRLLNQLQLLSTRYESQCNRAGV